MDDLRERQKGLVQRFNWLRDSGVCSPTTRVLLDDAQCLLAEVMDEFQELVDWEYRWAREDGDHAWPFGPFDEEEGETLEAVEAAPVNDPEPEYFEGTHIERRRKAVSAGEWEPLTTNHTIHTQEDR